MRNGLLMSIMGNCMGRICLKMEKRINFLNSSMCCIMELDGLMEN